MTRYLILDYETRSEADLKAVGGFEYARHESTCILCVSWRLGPKEELRQQLKRGEPAKIWAPPCEELSEVAIWRELLVALVDPSIVLVAHNAIFEQVITRFVLGRSRWVIDSLRKIPHERWICTASMAAAVALPRNLEGACLALNLPIQKDMEGRRLMLKMSKPRKPTKKNPAKWHNSIRDLKRLMAYCQKDVDAETLLFLTLPELHPVERKVWLLDQKINFRGFEADTELVKSVLKMVKEETENLHAETKELAKGTALTSVAQREAVLDWLQGEGVFLPDLKAKTVSDAIKTGLVEGRAKRMLEIRQAVSKTSTAKYQAFKSRSRSDGRVRDILVYHTASTGRWGGSGVQPQNLFKSVLSQDELEAAIPLICGTEGINDRLEMLRLLFGDPMTTFASCLRSVITAPKGRELFCADYAAIEARVIFWVAGHEHGCKAFFENRPMYEEMACVIYNIDRIENVTKLQRQVGKQAVLGCSYGMGPTKFLATCKNFGIEIEEATAKAAVTAYRTTHSPVVKLWSNLERAAIAAVKTPKKKFRINRTSWWVERGFLWCELPSGRRLAYYGPTVKYEPSPWGDDRPVLYHFGVNPLTRKWESSGTYGGRLCENVVQAIARDLMAWAMLRIEAAGYEITLSVHDELLAERDKGTGSVSEFENLMAETPPWADGCPVRVEGWKGVRYRK